MESKLDPLLFVSLCKLSIKSGLSRRNIVTDPSGKSFLSYRRSRAHEAALLITAQRLHGIPTWQDIGDLDSGPTEALIRKVIKDATTANAILWITPDVALSPFIHNVEVPQILSRVEAGTGFFAVPVAAGGLDFEKAAAALGPNARFHHMQGWNQMKADNDPIDYAFAAKVAVRVLRRRLKEIHRRLPLDQPLQIRLSTRDPEPFTPGIALSLDWHSQFTNREASPEVWDQKLYPALMNVGSSLCLEAPGRTFEASGKPSLAAAVALGMVFLAPRTVRVAWRQFIPGQPEQLWSLEAGKTNSQIESRTTHHDTNSTALAVLVAIARSRLELRNDFTASQGSLPTFRALIEIGKADGTRYDLANPIEAGAAAYSIVGSINQVRDEIGAAAVHLFLAVPAGLAMMVGQLLNGFPEVQLYEHVPGASPGPYRPATRLHPSV